MSTLKYSCACTLSSIHNVENDTSTSVANSININSTRNRVACPEFAQQESMVTFVDATGLEFEKSVGPHETKYGGQIKQQQQMKKATMLT